MLDENSNLIQAVMEAQNKGEAQKSVHLISTIHRNLLYLGSLSESNPNLAQIIPPPPTFGQPQPQQSQGNMPPQPSGKNRNQF